MSCLKFLPVMGSHTTGGQSDGAHPAQWPEDAGLEVVSPELAATDVVCFTEACWHAAFDGEPGLRSKCSPTALQSYQMHGSDI